jgi:hypothetical protein
MEIDMLTFFQIRKNFYKLSVHIAVDCTRELADLMVTYDRIIVGQQELPYYDVSTPDKANAWLCRPCGERGNFIEYTEWLCRSGVMGKSKEIA